MANQIVSFKYTFTFCMHLSSEDIGVFKLHIILGKAGHTAHIHSKYLLHRNSSKGVDESTAAA